MSLALNYGASGRLILATAMRLLNMKILERKSSKHLPLAYSNDTLLLALTFEDPELNETLLFLSIFYIFYNSI